MSETQPTDTMSEETPKYYDDMTAEQFSESLFKLDKVGVVDVAKHFHKKCSKEEGRMNQTCRLLGAFIDTSGEKNDVIKGLKKEAAAKDKELHKMSKELQKFEKIATSTTYDLSKTEQRLQDRIQLLAAVMVQCDQKEAQLGVKEAELIKIKAENDKLKEALDQRIKADAAVTRSKKRKVNQQLLNYPGLKK